EEALARTDLAIAEFRHVIDDLWPAPEDDASTRTRNHHTNRINTLTGLWDTNTSRLGNTAYAAERAITEYTDWNTAIRPTGQRIWPVRGGQGPGVQRNDRSGADGPQPVGQAAGTPDPAAHGAVRGVQLRGDPPMTVPAGRCQQGLADDLDGVGAVR
ncbi:MAG TPA: DUF932 domain-containing protein, partial [Mycobacterium sp.]|nr:DUF932 domain-containing protein [Mycobacterium sp.]